MRLTIGNHAEESTARVVILLVFPQMRGELIDALGQYCNLHLWGASILVVDGCFLDDLGLLSDA